MGATKSVASVRSRTDADLPALMDVLAAQQPYSRYPFRWPLPFPVEEFVKRSSELSAWTAEVDGHPVGHVSVTRVGATTDPGDGGAFARIWSAGAGRSADRLACVSALFVDHGLQGRGIGGALLDHAVREIRAVGSTPVLDVVPAHGRALAIYRHLGWVGVGHARPTWLADSEEDVVLMVLPS